MSEPDNPPSEAVYNNRIAKEQTMTKQAAIRQGDVLIVPSKAIPQTARAVVAENGRLIVARGESTGHHHSFPHRRGVTLFRDDGSGGSLYLKTDAPVALSHQEHTALEVQPGTCKVVIQRSFVAGVVRTVVD